MSVWGTTVTGKVLAETEFSDFLCARYNINPPNLQNKCNSCMHTFLVHHAFSCSNGGLVIKCHNERCNTIIHLYRQAFSPNYVRGKPLIHLDHSRSEEEVRHGGSITETWGDVSIQSLWEIQTGAIIDVRFGDADAKTWNPEGMDKILDWWEKINNDKHGKH